MIKKINSLRRKKGFTIIELIVVIGIIGILTTIIVATMSYDARPSVGKGLAKDLFYVAQDAATSAKVAHPHALDGYSAGTFAGVYLQVDNTGNIEVIKTISITGGGGAVANITYEEALDPDNPFAIAANPSSDAAVKANDKKAFQNTMAHAVSEYIATKDCYEGAYFVAIDKSFRVVCAYWTSEKGEIKSGHDAMPRDCTLKNGELLCSYPVEYCDAYSVMFVS